MADVTLVRVLDVEDPPLEEGFSASAFLALRSVASIVSF